MSYWSFVKISLLFVALLALLTGACDKESSSHDAVVKAIDKTSKVESFRSTTNRITLTDSYVQSYSATEEHSGRCTNHLYEITAKNSAGNTTTIPFDTDWYLEPGTPTSWQESILIGSTGYWRSSVHPSWGWLIAECWGGSGPLNNELYLYRFLGSIEVLPTEEIGGVSCKHYRGEVDFDAYVDMQIEEIKKLSETPIILTEGGSGNISWLDNMERMHRSEATAEFWIDEEVYIRQLKTEKRFLNAPTGAQDEWTTEVTVTRYSDFDQSITIEPPPAPSPTFPTPTPTPSPHNGLPP